MDHQETKRIDDFLANPELTDEALAEATGGWDRGLEGRESSTS